MTIGEFEYCFSKPRISRFLLATKGNTASALQLYKLNIELSQTLFAILSFFEVAFRNHIDYHYRKTFNDNNWLKNQCKKTGIFSHPDLTKLGFGSREKIFKSCVKPGTFYTHDRLVSTLNLGFWTFLFSPILFRIGGQNLHKIYASRPKGTPQKLIYNELEDIRWLRNRIAHHEPICFNIHNEIFTKTSERAYHLILKHLTWLGYNPSKLFMGLDDTDAIFSSINQLNSLEYSKN